MKPIIILFEDRDRDRFNWTKKAAQALNYDIFPVTFDRGFYIKQIDVWIGLIIERSSCAYILVDHELGRDDLLEKTLTRNDVVEIINGLKNSDSLLKLFPNISNLTGEIANVDWKFQLALIIMEIANRLGCKACISCSSAGSPPGYKSFLSKQPDELSINSETTLIRWIKEENKNNSFLSKKLNDKNWEIASSYEVKDHLDAQDKSNLLEIFLRKTHRMDVHDDANLATINSEFNNFTGFEIYSVPNILSKEYLIHNALKSLIGKDALIGEDEKGIKGTRPTSILSIYLLLMGAVKDRTFQGLQDELISISDIEIISESKFLPFQSPDVALETLNTLFKLFCKLVIYKKGHAKSGEISLLHSSASVDGIKMCFGIDFLQLKEGLSKAIKRERCGDVSSLILKYATLVETVKSNENQSYTPSLFCSESKIELRSYQNNHTEILLKSCNS
jgi:hypothetical protein